MSSSSEETAIRALVASWIRALHDKDVDRLMSHYTSDVMAYDLAPPLRHDAAGYRRGFEQWFPTWSGPIGLEIVDLAVTAADTLAFCHGLSHLTGRRTDGTSTDVWARTTACLTKAGGEWRIAHEHVSVPFYMDGSFRAAVDLKP